MKVKCDSCNKVFEMTKDMLQEKYLGAMYTEVYYVCPTCNKKYLVCILNKKCRELQKKLKDNINNKNERYLIQELKKEMNKINNKE